jgi:Cd2+/Zn2+-exporting ATPase
MKKYKLKNLDCASCATKIESQLRALPIVRGVSMDFGTGSMLVDTDDIDAVIKKIHSIESDIVVERAVDTTQIAIDHRPLTFSIIYVVIFLVALTLSFMYKALNLNYIFIALYLLSGYKVIIKAFKNLVSGIFFDENSLMTIATIGALCINEIPEAAGVMIFYLIGESLQERSIDKTRKSVKSLLELRPDYASVINHTHSECAESHCCVGESAEIKLPPEQVVVGNTIIVRPGEKIPLDGVITSGESQIDTSALTGESIPRAVRVGDSVLAGTINNAGLLYISVTKPASESSISKILDLVENATHKKAKTEKFFTSFAKVYTPIVLVIALFTALVPPIFFSMPFSDAIYRALVILVISCPCALVVSIPLTYFGAIGGAAKKGMLIKGSKYLDSLCRVRNVVFDKTGTITRGNFEVTQVCSLIPNLSESELLHIVAAIERYSNHPIATSIINAHKMRMPLRDIMVKKATALVETPGKGITALMDGKSIIVGNATLLCENQVTIPIETIHALSEKPATCVHVAINGLYAGYILIADSLKHDSMQAMSLLKKMGHRLIMLTGDHSSIAGKYSKMLGMDTFYAELLPEEKVTRLNEIINSGIENTATSDASADASSSMRPTTIFVGDGINDAPVLATAHVGIAIGMSATDIAIDTADIVIVGDSLTKIPALLGTATSTRKIIIQNIVLALSVKTLFMILAFYGLATLWGAIFADVGVTLIAVINARRIIQ